MPVKPDNSDAASQGLVLPGHHNARFVSVFRWYVRRMLRKHFFAVRCHGTTSTVLTEIAASREPIIIALSHTSWWDPIISVYLSDCFCPEREGCAPMDTSQLRKFNFFRNLGLFGIDPDNPQSLRAMSEYVAQVFAHDARPTLWITPQGKFADVRAPLQVRPGAATIAAAHPGARVIAVAIEYAFWLDQRPEVFVRLERVEHPESGSVLRWHRAISLAMKNNAARLAAGVIARDPGAFTLMCGGDAPRTNIFYDLWQRIRGVRTDVSDAHRRTGG
jgi:1-acyl-sn-glycerol-3-phosphate acyltransferase